MPSEHLLQQLQNHCLGLCQTGLKSMTIKMGAINSDMSKIAMSNVIITVLSDSLGDKGMRSKAGQMICPHELNTWPIVTKTPDLSRAFSVTPFSLTVCCLMKQTVMTRNNSVNKRRSVEDVVHWLIRCPAWIGHREALLKQCHDHSSNSDDTTARLLCLACHNHKIAADIHTMWKARFGT